MPNVFIYLLAVWQACTCRNGGRYLCSVVVSQMHLSMLGQFCSFFA